MVPMRNFVFILFAVMASRSGLAEIPTNLRDDQLVAWCIVPFDSENRTPSQRAEMVRRLGLRRVAYDWRQQHVPTFEQEILEYKKHGIEYFAFWGAHENAFALFKKYDLHPQIWQTLASPDAPDQPSRVKAAAEQMLPLVQRTRRLGCKLGLYNHGGWGGEPENMVAVCEYLRRNHQADHVGIVYNLHHGHGHLDDLPDFLEQMKPYLLCFNLNGMTRDGDKQGQKILPLGEGEFDLRILKQVRQSGYQGPVGIIGHTQDDVELRLQDNLDGLHWLLPQLDGKPAGVKPELRTYSPQTDSPDRNADARGVLQEGRSEYRTPPITVECRVRLSDASGYNILVACDTKQSGDHWEIFTTPGAGELTVYLPGHKPDHVRSRSKICDGRPHTITMIYEPDRARLFSDGIQVASQAIESLDRKSVPGKIAIGRLVEGGLGCRGSIDWLRLSSGVREIPEQVVTKVTRDASTLLLWRHDDSNDDVSRSKPNNNNALTGGQPSNGDGSDSKATELLRRASRDGDASRGLLAFADAKTACLSCHRIGKHGGTVGPDLTAIGKQRKPEEIVESILHPSRNVKPEYVAHLVVDSSGNTRQGYLVREDDSVLVLRDPSDEQSKEIRIAIDEIELRREVGTLMPDNLAGTMSETAAADLVHFLCTLGTAESLSDQAISSVLTHVQGHAHAPAEFAYDRKPLQPELWPSWNHHVNRDRVYDYYAKQADYFRKQSPVPPLLPEYPGLDGGALGHWGNQDETTWADGRWNDTDLGSVHCGVFRDEVTVPRAVCVRLGKDRDHATCFDPDTLSYPVAWKGGFVTFSDHRHGFLAGLRRNGNVFDHPDSGPPGVPFQYNGFYRVGKRVVFSYRIGGREILDSPEIKNGQFIRVVTDAADHPLRKQIHNPPQQWPETIETEITLGSRGPYTIDSIGLPFDNPWNALMFCGGHAFLPDGSALVCTMQGDVWHVDGFAYPSRKATWRRFASGLHHPLGIVADEEGIFVLCRDQITRLHDLNDDGEADFYECFSNAFETSPAGHDFICGLQRDHKGNFYLASGNEGLVRVSPDGSKADTIATGFRNPDGLGVTPDGLVTVPCSEGGWTPASMICAIKTDEADDQTASTESIPHFGYRGPQNGKAPSLPLVYLPRGLDNSSGGQAYVSSDLWGPLKGQLVHFSFGKGNQFLLLRDEVKGQLQGAVVPLPGEFRSGAHRGRFHPIDGQLYVTGMKGWGTYTPDDGCFSRVRYTGDKVQLPIRFRAHENGIAITFSHPLDRATVSDPANHFAQAWNYRYSSAYGSPEFSARTTGVRGHDTLSIKSASLLDDESTLFLEIPAIQPVNQLHLRLQISPGHFQDVFVTVHKLADPFKNYPGYEATDKVIAPHPILADLAMATRSIPNPYQKKLKNAREVRIETGTNLTYQTRSLRVRPGEPIALTLANPDVVPHNWALAKPGTLERVGSAADRLISDPEAALRHYVPPTSDVLAYTDVVLPRGEFTIYFRAPQQPGHYPYLCTFPGHWKVMNGIMIVESP